MSDKIEKFDLEKLTKSDELFKSLKPEDLVRSDDASDALAVLLKAAKDQYNPAYPDPDTVPITIKDIAQIEVKEDEILAIGLPDNTTDEMLQAISKQLRAYFAKDKEKGVNRNILLYVGSWKFHVIKAQEAKEVQEFNKELRSL